MTTRQRIVLLLVVTVVAVILDQATKAWALKALTDFHAPDGLGYSFSPREVAGEWFWLFLAYNDGAAFGMDPHRLIPFLPRWAFYSLLTVVATVLLWLWVRRSLSTSLLPALAAALVAGGAWGNLFDRLRLDHVVDFLSVGIPGFEQRWPTFNLADAWITVGVVLLLFSENVRRPESPAGASPVAKSFPSKSA